jgi:hypothetical protein
MKIRWPALWFGPINLWTAPLQPALEDTMTATARDDDTVVQMLCLRNDELQAEKDALVAQVDRLEEELAEAKRAQAIMRDTFAAQVQQAVSRARRGWAAQGSPWVKAQWQAEALEEAADRAAPHVAPWLRALARDYRRQAERSVE